MKNAKMIVVAAALAAVAGPVVQTVATAAEEGEGPVLTLEQALAQARKRNRGLVAERARVAQAQAAVDQGWAALFPTVAAQGKYTRNNTKFEFGRPVIDPKTMMPVIDPKTMMAEVQNLRIQPINQLDGVVSATLPLLVLAAYPALNAAKTSEQAAQANFDVSESSVLLSVAQLYYAAVISDEVLTARESNVKVAAATLQNAKVRFGAGTVTKVDVDRAELALGNAQQAQREAVFGRQKTYRALATLIQREGPFQVQVPNFPAEAHEERELESALQLRPEFRALRLSLESLQSQRNAYALRWAPSLSAFGNARWFNYDNFAAQRHAWAVGAQLDWVLFDGGARDAQRHLAAAQAEETAARAEVLRDSIRDDLADGRRYLETKQQAVTVAERSVQLAKETLDLVRVQYAAGTVTQVDLLQAQDQLVVSQEALARAHFDLASADLALRHAAGTFPPK